MNTNLTVEDLKVIRLALSQYSLSKPVLVAIDNVDIELAQHGLKVTYQSLPKRKYQRQASGEYIFEQING
jgi:hypothetical protein